MKQHISVGIITTNKWKYFQLFSQFRDMFFFVLCKVRSQFHWWSPIWSAAMSAYGTPRC